jgi:hypothetical protein
MRRLHFPPFRLYDMLAACNPISLSSWLHRHCMAGECRYPYWHSRNYPAYRLLVQSMHPYRSLYTFTIVTTYPRQPFTSKKKRITTTNEAVAVWLSVQRGSREREFSVRKTAFINRRLPRVCLIK